MTKTAKPTAFLSLSLIPEVSKTMKELSALTVDSRSVRLAYIPLPVKSFKTSACFRQMYWNSAGTFLSSALFKRVSLRSDQERNSFLADAVPIGLFYRLLEKGLVQFLSFLNPVFLDIGKNHSQIHDDAGDMVRIDLPVQCLYLIQGDNQRCSSGACSPSRN